MPDTPSKLLRPLCPSVSEWLVWNRLRFVKDSDTGKRISKLNPEREPTVREVPDLRVIDQDIWDGRKTRQGEMKGSSIVKGPSELPAPVPPFFTAFDLRCRREQKYRKVFSSQNAKNPLRIGLRHFALIPPSCMLNGHKANRVIDDEK